MGNGKQNTNGKPGGWGARLKRGFRLFYLRVLRLRGQPEEVAGGLAIGVGVGLTPTIPLHLVFAILLAYLTRRSKLAAALGSQVANPFFFPFIYLLDYKVGQAITGTRGPTLAFNDFSVSYLLTLTWDIYYPLLVGGMVVGSLSLLPTYFATRKLARLYQERRRKRLEKIGLPSQTA